MSTVGHSLNWSDLRRSDDSGKLAMLSNYTDSSSNYKDKWDCRRKLTVTPGGGLMEQHGNQPDVGEDRTAITYSLNTLDRAIVTVTVKLSSSVYTSIKKECWSMM